MGYTERMRGQLFEANRDARRLTKLIATYQRMALECRFGADIRSDRPPELITHLLVSPH